MPALIYATTGNPTGRACVASGHAAAAPPRSVMNSRRRIRPSNVKHRSASDKVIERGMSVKSRHSQRKKTCPLHPRKRTCALQLGMSAKGQKRTSRVLFNYFVGDLVKTQRHF